MAVSVEAFRRLGGWERYALARALVLLDRLDGEITEIVAAKGLLDVGEASRAAAGWLDAYANSLYRSVKNARNGHLLAARLDATESMGFLLELLFAPAAPRATGKQAGTWKALNTADGRQCAWRRPAMRSSTSRRAS